MIERFIGRYNFLSNFYPVPAPNMDIRFSGHARGDLRGEPISFMARFRTVEHAYQAHKSLNPSDWIKAMGEPTAGKIKRMGRRFTLRPEWDTIKLDVMADLLRRKFRPTSDLAVRLMETSGQELREGNTWHDTFWGVDAHTGEGFNHLGRLLMDTRKDLLQ